MERNSSCGGSLPAWKERVFGLAKKSRLGNGHIVVKRRGVEGDEAREAGEVVEASKKGLTVGGCGRW